VSVHVQGRRSILRHLGKEKVVSYATTREGGKGTYDRH
jgi:hypothetical protein